MELKLLSDSVFYIPNASNIGVIKKDEGCILIDTGLDAETGKKVLALLAQQGLSVNAIINTHSHADHCGGNRIIKEKTSCRVYAPTIESSIIENPILEPVGFFSWASPLQELKNKFLMADPCKVDEAVSPGDLEINGLPLRIVPLPGHSINQMGIDVDNVLFCADSFFSGETIEKHKIPFFTDIEYSIKTLDHLKQTTYGTYVPAHLVPLSDPLPFIEANLQAIDRINETVLESLGVKGTTEQLLERTCDSLEVSISSVQQYYLLKTTLLACIAHLQKIGEIGTKVEKNHLFFKRT
ncbi:MBL fold metallo-hydrolase [Candidatus Micrarchaeota archaeon]|nr:MBL fold metallo-hydrolase [Candidatus Micrarchaeota archaeon]